MCVRVVEPLPVARHVSEDASWLPMRAAGRGTGAAGRLPRSASDALGEHLQVEASGFMSGACRWWSQFGEIPLTRVAYHSLGRQTTVSEEKADALPPGCFMAYWQGGAI